MSDKNSQGSQDRIAQTGGDMPTSVPSLRSQWIPALVFVACLLIFLTVIFFLDPIMSGLRIIVLYTFISLIAGLSAYFMGGGITLAINREINEGNFMRIKATSGIALFILTFLLLQYFSPFKGNQNTRVAFAQHSFLSNFVNNLESIHRGLKIEFGMPDSGTERENQLRRFVYRGETQLQMSPVEAIRNFCEMTYGTITTNRSSHLECLNCLVLQNNQLVNFESVGDPIRALDRNSTILRIDVREGFTLTEEQDNGQGLGTYVCSS